MSRQKDFQSQAHTVMYMLQSASTMQVFQDIKLSMHKGLVAAACI